MHLTRMPILAVELMKRDDGKDDEALGWRKNEVGAVASLAFAFSTDRGVIVRQLSGKGVGKSQ
jgi:hypothetical protein